MARGRISTSLLGDRVRSLRRERGMTLAVLAKESGISAATLSKLENGLTGLNLDNAIALSAAFHMPVSALLDDAGPASGACSVAHTQPSYSHSVDALDFKVLHDDLPGQRNVFWEVRVTAHSLEDFGPFHAHSGEEFLYVLSGQIKFVVDGRDSVTLKRGESVQFDSSLKHAYVSASKADAVILMANTVLQSGRSNPSLGRRRS
ncbi:MAG: helix-turn-helix domain-containing protein [Alphaproteobacteria bacterium]